MNTIVDAKRGWSRPQMASRAAQDVPNGSYVNLGIGIPELVAAHLPSDRTVVFHSENGVLGVGPPPGEDERDPELINAGKKPITLVPGASFFHHADSFAMIRGGHIDFCFLGAMQVAANGDLANWITSDPDAIPAVGGAMDLVAGAKKIVVLSELTARNGSPKLVDVCTYPLTGLGVVQRVVTNAGVFDIEDGSFVLRELAQGFSVEEVRAKTSGPLKVAHDLRVPELPEVR